MDQERMKKRKKIIYELITSEAYVPMKIKEIAILLQIPKENRAELKQVLEELEEEGKVARSKKGKYSKSLNQLMTGTFLAHPKGFGFVRVEDEEEDIYVPEKKTNGALHKDTVQISVGSAPYKKRREGTVTKVLEHGLKEVVGTFQKSKNFGFVYTDNLKFTKDIYIPLEHSMGAVTGHKVVVEITEYGQKGRNPEGQVAEILGHENDPGVDILSIIKEYELPEGFPDKVMKEAENTGTSVTAEESRERLDLRQVQMVTIDGEDAKDLDDAVSLEMVGENYKLGVHIADVTHYVREGDVLNKEAWKRGTSIYLADRVIPMLPHKLSNGICSLNEREDRLALSCIMTISPKGRLVDHKVAETVIHVDRRMTYTSVKRILADYDTRERKEYEELVPMLEKMEQLSVILRKNRRKRGSIDFDFPEAKIILDEKGKPEEIRPYDRSVATKLIEDFMLMANETVAQDYFWQEVPFVYRIHDNPDPEKMQKLELFINNFGYGIKLGKGEVHPKELQKLLSKIEGTPEEMLISRLTLRSMKQAKYTTENSGHFGLAATHYCHFTSPIRRYPDLQIHRIIKETLNGKMNSARMAHYEGTLPETAKHSSERERLAEEAERETIKLKKAEYMQRFIGKSFDGVISGITSWGIYVELDNTIEGMVHVTSLYDDHYFYNEERQEMVGRHTHKAYKLGEKVRIRCDRCGYSAENH